jgi:hypothetical protein
VFVHHNSLDVDRTPLAAFARAGKIDLVGSFDD